MPNPSGWPSYSDDTGTLLDGTVLSKAFFDSIGDALYAHLTDPLNPMITPADITSEVVAARAGYDSLNERLDVVENVGLVIPSTVHTTARAQSLARRNWVSGDLFDIWPLGDGSGIAPAHFRVTSTGANPTTTRCGVAAYNEAALGDTTRKVGRFSCKIENTGAVALAGLHQDLCDSAMWSSLCDHLEGRVISFGVWVKASDPNTARMHLYADAVASLIQTTSYHSGGGGWEFLANTYTIPSNATQLSIRLAMEGSAVRSAYWSAPTVILGDLTQLMEAESTLRRFDECFYLGTGNIATNPYFKYEPSRPTRIEACRWHVTTAPAGSAAILDLRSWDGAAETTMYASAACSTMADGGTRSASGRVDGTYARRCLRGDADAAIGAGAYAVGRFTQVGSGTPGAGATVRLTVCQYDSPLEAFRDYDDLGV